MLNYQRVGKRNGDNYNRHRDLAVNTSVGASRAATFQNPRLFGLNARSRYSSLVNGVGAAIRRARW